MADEDILNWEKLLKEWKDEPEKKLREATQEEQPAGNIVEPPKSSPHKEKYFKQRHNQREIIFWFIVILTGLSFLSFICVVGLQSYVRVWGGDSRFELLSDGQMQIFGVSVFAQIIGLMFVITKALWDNKDLEKM